MIRGAAQGAARLYADHRFAHADGRARFVPLDLATTAEATDPRFPLHLNTGRLRDQWHGMSRTARSARLFSHEPLPTVQLHAGDMARRGLADGMLVQVKSRRGDIVLPVMASDTLRPGHAFVAMHWGERTLGHAGINALTLPATDATSRQPELKHAAVRVEPAQLPWRLVLLRRADALPSAADGVAAGSEQALAWQARLAPLLADAGYRALTLTGRTTPTVAVDAAWAAPPPRALLDALLAALDFDTALAYDDPARHIVKRARVDADGICSGLLLAGETAAAGWLRGYVTDAVALGEARRWLFAPLATVPVARADAGRTVCNCLGVTDRQIGALLEQGVDLAGVQAQLKCGTECGSCVPELKRMAAAHAVASPA